MLQSMRLQRVGHDLSTEQQQQQQQQQWMYLKPRGSGCVMASDHVGYKCAFLLDTQAHVFSHDICNLLSKILKK